MEELFVKLVDVQQSNSPFEFEMPSNLEESQQKNSETTDFVPSTIMTAGTIQDQAVTTTLKVLLDPGASRTFIHRRALPKGANPKRLTNKIETMTAAGTMATTLAVQLRNLVFPEFSLSMTVESLHAFVFDQENCPYDLIMGRDFLEPNKMDIKYSTKTMEWFDRVAPMKEKSRPTAVYFFNDCADEEESLEEHFATEILPSKYEKVDVHDIARQQTHLSKDKQADLAACLEGYEKLFSGKLGVYPRKKIHLDLIPGAQPVHCRAYAVAHLHQKVFKDECWRLVEEGVLEPCGATDHAYPTFIIPKKDGRVRWVSDFRKLNAMIKRRVYPLPKIQDILTRRSGYKFFTKIDISMQYYTFELDEESSWLCVIVTPFGKFRYKRLPMGIKQSTDVAQEIMESLFMDIEGVECYLDDIGLFSNDWKSHLTLIQKVLTRLQENGFTVNPLKCEWAVQETDWLGYWLTPTGLKPWSKKIRTILQLKEPTNLRELRSFIGAVNYYRDMWPRRAHILAPLTQLTGSTFVWEKQHQEAFNNMKALIAHEAMLAYPDHNLPFHIFTDASDFQLGSVILQNDRPVAYYSRKLNSAQRNYTTIEKELLSIVETLREFRSMLLGADITIITDHKNLTYTNLNTQRVLRWRLYVEEFHPRFQYIQGTKNVLADFFSRTPLAVEKSVVQEPQPKIEESQLEELLDDDVSYEVASRQKQEAMLEEHHSIVVDDFMLADCYLEASEGLLQELLFVHMPEGVQNPVTYQRLAEAQQQQPALWNLPQVDPVRYFYQPFDNLELVCYRAVGQHNFKIMIPNTLLVDVVRWYHQLLNHPGAEKLENSIGTHFHHQRLRELCAEMATRCPTCQSLKQQSRGYGHLAPREAVVQPFYETQTDLIGPWNISIHGQIHTFHALTITDTATNLTELTRIDNKTSRHVAMKYGQAWLSRYPKPVRCVHDQGTEFMGQDFQRMLEVFGIRPVPISVRNPQANSIAERMHQTVGNLLRTMLYTNPPGNVETATERVDEALAAAQYSLRTSVHTTLGISPGAIVFHRDMILDVPYVADLLLLREKRQALIDYNVRRENNKRRNYDYQIGQWVLELIKTKDGGKLAPKARGPYQIAQVHTNGTLTIRRGPALDRVNIRNLRPFFR